MLKSKILASPHVYRDYNIRTSVYNNPFVEGLRASLFCQDVATSKYVLSRYLRLFYERFQPSSVFEYLDLKLEDAPGLIHSEQPWTAPYPWADSSIQADLQDMASGLFSEAQRYGFNLSLSDGCSWCGPVSEKKLEAEVERYLTVAISIRDNGFQLDQDWTTALQVVALVDENGRYCFLLKDGAHRFAACAALGFDLIPYKVVRTVYKSEASSWPNVKSGLYSQTGAVRLFEKFMEASQPSSLKPPQPVKLTGEEEGSSTSTSPPLFFGGEEKKSNSSGTSRIKTKIKNLFQAAKSHQVMMSHPVAGDVYYGLSAMNYDKYRMDADYWKAEDTYMAGMLPRLPEIQNVLDVACGTGRFLPLYTELKLNVACLDSSIDMLMEAKAKLADSFDSKVNFVQGMADTLPFSSGEFDLVVCFRFLSWIVPAEIAINCIREIARVSSKYVILELCVNKISPDVPLEKCETMWNKLTLTGTSNLLHECGLDVLQADELIDLPDHPGLTAFLCRKSK